MVDLAHNFGGDLSIAATGDLATADGSIWTQQRIVRRLATNPGAYLWALDYGAGLPAMVGDPVSQPRITGIVTAQMQLEQGVDHTQPVGVNVVATNLGSVAVTISYTDAASGSAVSLVLPT